MQKLKIIGSESCFAFLNKYHIQNTIIKNKQTNKTTTTPRTFSNLRAVQNMKVHQYWITSTDLPEPIQDNEQ